MALVLMSLVLMSLVASAPCHAQSPADPVEPAHAADPPPAGEAPLVAPGRVNVLAVARDEQIDARLTSIVLSTGWFTEPEVTVREGVVFLDGGTSREQFRKWVGDLARGTQDVVAVVNRIEVLPPPVWDTQFIIDGSRALVTKLLRSLPRLLGGLFILVVAWFLARRVARLMHRLSGRVTDSPLLKSVFGHAAGLLVAMAGGYLVLQLAGLSDLALTMLGGTGLVGLALGIAFRDITENFLASIFLSVQQPFRTSDLIEIGGYLGYVEQLNIRTTVLLTLDGNQVQLPNAIVYKSPIRNFTASPNRRESFTVGIGYDTLIQLAQETALAAVTAHPAVLTEPAPLVLVDELGSATVSLRVMFWLNGREHSWLKVKSAVQRAVKRAFQDAGISMPGDAGERVFPERIDVRLVKAGEDGRQAPSPAELTPPAAEREIAVTEAEAGLESEAALLRDQAGVEISTPGNLLDAPGRPDADT